MNIKNTANREKCDAVMLTVGSLWNILQQRGRKPELNELEAIRNSSWMIVTPKCPLLIQIWTEGISRWKKLSAKAAKYFVCSHVQRSVTQRARKMPSRQSGRQTTISSHFSLLLLDTVGNSPASVCIAAGKPHTWLTSWRGRSREPIAVWLALGTNTPRLVLGRDDFRDERVFKYAFKLKFAVGASLTHNN